MAPGAATVLPAEVLLLGEQHTTIRLSPAHAADACRAVAGHPQPVGAVVLRWQRDFNAALLPVDATPAQVPERFALETTRPGPGPPMPRPSPSRAGWRAGAGGNLPCTQNRSAMRDDL